MKEHDGVKNHSSTRFLSQSAFNRSLVGTKNSVESLALVCIKKIRKISK